eukprot:TRINITY_DN15529_c0_g1_i1.p1 TRINITY_DN15529_c0_g1~~TRINITY_DN15529_c0_g1_i1.p1  ORF type:complete len:310 (+),score=34.11 TRINITY_DN15529_c0_g1_i1:62-931(+)
MNQIPSAQAVAFQVAIQLMHDTCAYVVDRNLTFEELGPYLLHTSDFGFGFSGVLTLDSNGDRSSGMYALYVVRDSDFGVDNVWWQQIGTSTVVSEYVEVNEKRWGLGAIIGAVVVTAVVVAVVVAAPPAALAFLFLGRSTNDEGYPIVHVAAGIWLPISPLQADRPATSVSVDSVPHDIIKNDPTAFGVCPVNNFEALRLFTITVPRKVDGVNVTVYAYTQQDVSLAIVGTLRIVAVSKGETFLQGTITPPPVFYLGYSCSGAAVVLTHNQISMAEKSWMALGRWIDSI